MIVKTARNIQERLAGRHVRDPLACGEGPRLSTELPDRELNPYKGFLRVAPTRNRGKLARFSIPR